MHELSHCPCCFSKPAQADAVTQSELTKEFCESWQFAKPGHPFRKGKVEISLSMVKPKPSDGDTDEFEPKENLSGLRSTQVFDPSKSLCKFPFKDFSNIARSYSTHTDSYDVSASKQFKVPDLKKSFMKLVELEKSGLQEQFGKHFQAKPPECSLQLSEISSPDSVSPEESFSFKMF